MDRRMCSILANPQSCLPWPILYTEFRGLGFHQKKELGGINGDVQPRAGNGLAELTPYLLLLCWFLVSVNETTLEVWSTLGLISRTNLDTSSIYFVSSHNKFMCALSLHPYTHIIGFVGEGGHVWIAAQHGQTLTKGLRCEQEICRLVQSTTDRTTTYPTSAQSPLSHLRCFLHSLGYTKHASNQNIPKLQDVITHMTPPPPSHQNLQLRRRLRAPGARNLIIQQRRQEIRIVLARDLAGKVLRRELKLVALGRLGSQLLRLLLEQLERVGLVDALALGRRHAVADPLPELGARDLGCGGVLPVFVVLVCVLEKRGGKGGGRTSGS